MADIGFRAVLSVNDGASNAQVVFPGLVTLSFPKRKVGEKDVTPHDNKDSANNPSYHKTYIPTLIDSDLIPVEMYYTAAQYVRLDALLGQKKTGTADTTFLIKAPPVDASGAAADGTNPQDLTFKGYVASLEGPVFNKEDEMVIKFEIRANNKPTIAHGTGS